MTQGAREERPAVETGASPSTGVWDLGVRLFHWLLVAAVGVVLVTGLCGPRQRLDVHVCAGATVAALIAFRVLWGFAGSSYARFSSFPVGYSNIAADVTGFSSGRRRRYLGHNPLGSLMVLALLVVLTLSLLTGVVTLGGEEKQGPLAFATSYATGAAMHGAHQIFAYVLLSAIVGHILGVGYESFHGGSGLVRAMLTGRKPIAGAVGHAPIAKPWPLTVGLLFLLSLTMSVRVVVALSSRPAYGVPVGPLDPTYLRECGSCHFAYPPSLMPTARWFTVMSRLGDHFGEDASLPPDVNSAIAAFLTNNAAEKWDTRAAHEFALGGLGDPLRVTTTPFWVKMHRAVADRTFKSRAVGARGACDACHGDAATGRFDPQAIHVPQKALQ